MVRRGGRNRRKNDCTRFVGRRLFPLRKLLCRESTKNWFLKLLCGFFGALQSLLKKGNKRKTSKQPPQLIYHDVWFVVWPAGCGVLWPPYLCLRFNAVKSSLAERKPLLFRFVPRLKAKAPFGTRPFECKSCVRIFLFYSVVKILFVKTSHECQSKRSKFLVESKM